MLTGYDIEHRLLDQLLETLRALPDVLDVCSEHQAPVVIGKPERYDALIYLRVAGKSLVLLVEAKKSLYPRDARQALWHLRTLDRHAVNNANTQRLPMVIAESISRGARDVLREERVGYYDSGGSLLIPVPGAYVYIDKPPPKALAKVIRSLYSGRRAQVLLALLSHHEAWVGVQGLAAEAHVSPATASQVLTQLERFDWLESKGQGPAKRRHLREPGQLLDAWSQHIAIQRPPSMRRFYVPGLRDEGSTNRLAQVLEDQGVEYAMTHEVAAQRYAPFLSSVSQMRCRLIPGPAVDAALADLNAHLVTEGANLSLMEVKSSDELLFRQKLDGVWLASPIQVYLDLLRGEGRAKELAAHLRRERIGF